MTSAAVRKRLARSVISTAQAMGEQGINNGMSGNVSVRIDEGMLITPSSVAYSDMTVEDIVLLRNDETWTAANDRRPSSEWRFHLDLYTARSDAAAIVHAHPVSATALSCHRRGIDRFHYMVGIAGGHDIRCAKYATFGTPELSANVVEAIADRKACLLANHGMLALGSSLSNALDVAIEVEVLAGQYLAALAIGEPSKLTKKQMDDVLAKMNAGQGYGSS